MNNVQYKSEHISGLNYIFQRDNVIIRISKLIQF